MARSGTEVTVKGNNVIDVELKYSSNGNGMLKLRLATERWRKQGDAWEKTNVSFFNIQVWGDLAEAAAGIIQKGQRIIVTGYLEERNWEDKTTGEKRYATQVVANDISIPVEDIESLVRVKREKRDDATPSAGAAPKSAPTTDPFDEELDF